MLNNVLGLTYIPKNQVFMLSKPDDSGFIQAYLKIREKEGRLYTDSELQNLPATNKKNLKKEWLSRFNSAKRLIKELKNKIKPESIILDIGCGNGLISNLFQKELNCYVLGLDLNEFELEQAARVFSNEKLSFCYGDIFADIFQKDSFDYIVMAASVQYFENLGTLFKQLEIYLKPEGSVYIVDSPIYQSPEKAKQAKQRSNDYYQKMGFSELSKSYFHHNWLDFHAFQYQILFNPEIILYKFIRKCRLRSISPFPIIKLIFRKNEQN